MDTVLTSQYYLITFAIIFFIGVILSKLADSIKIPDVVIFLLAGILMGPAGLGILSIPVDSTVYQLVLTLGASYLLFQGGLSVRLNTLKEVWITLLLLSTVGVVIMIVIVGFTAQMVLGIGLVYAFLLAAVIASTDPATIIPVFLSVKIKQHLSQTILSESAFNDATGAIATFAVLGIITAGEFSVAGTLVKFLFMAGAGVFIGILFGFAAEFLLSKKSKGMFADYAQFLVIPLIVACYMTADRFGASGFMAVFVAGLVLGNPDEFGWTIKDSAKEQINIFVNNGSVLLRTAIFILLGSTVDFGLVSQYFWQGLIIVGVFMFIARPITVLLCAQPDKRAKWPKNEILFMFWTRETGVIPVALAGLLASMQIQHAGIISSIVFMAVLSTLLIQATTTEFVAKKLKVLDTNIIEDQSNKSKERLDVPKKLNALEAKRMTK